MVIRCVSCSWFLEALETLTGRHLISVDQNTVLNQSHLQLQIAPQRNIHSISIDSTPSTDQVPHWLKSVPSLPLPASTDLLTPLVM